jgi:hypothetical protein
MAAQHRFAIILPILSVVITSGLWLSARAQYLRSVGLPAVGWTDYVPPSLQAAALLNIPVAFFAQPLYRLVHDTVSKWELVALLLGAVVLWSYVGWRIDSGNSASHSKTALHMFAAVVGCLFAVVILIQTITMFHVGLLYKTIAVFWSLLMFRHFLLLLHTPPAMSKPESLPRRRWLPRISVNSMAGLWAVALILGGLALSPRDSSGAPNVTIAHVFAVCYALLLLATAYGVLVHLMIGWRRMSTAVDRRSYVVWLGCDTFLVVAGVAAVGYVAVRG